MESTRRTDAKSVVMMVRREMLCLITKELLYEIASTWSTTVDQEIRIERNVIRFT